MFAQEIVEEAKESVQKRQEQKGKGIGGGKGSERPQPWPLKESDVPPNASKVLQPVEDTEAMEEETMKEEEMAGTDDTYGFL